MDVLKLDEHDINIINSCFLFKNLSREDIMCILSNAKCILFKKSEVIYDLENYAHSIGLILHGNAEVLNPSSSNNELIMKELSENDVFGVAAVFNDAAEYVTKIIAKSDCKVIFFSQEILRATMQKNFEFVENYISFLSGRIHFLNKKIGALSFSNATEAVSNWLSKNYKYENGKYVINLSVSLSKLAAILNIGRASLYRSLDELEKHGIISKEGKKIEILDIDKIVQPIRREKK